MSFVVIKATQKISEFLILCFVILWHLRQCFEAIYLKRAYVSFQSVVPLVGYVTGLSQMEHSRGQRNDGLNSVCRQN